MTFLVLLKCISIPTDVPFFQSVSEPFTWVHCHSFLLFIPPFELLRGSFDTVALYVAKITMSLKSDVICAVVITWVAALLAQIGRVFARRMTKVQWWWDDYFCLGAFVSSSLVNINVSVTYTLLVDRWYRIQCRDDLL